MSMRPTSSPMPSIQTPGSRSLSRAASLWLGARPAVFCLPCSTFASPIRAQRARGRLGRISGAARGPGGRRHHPAAVHACRRSLRRNRASASLPRLLRAGSGRRSHPPVRTRRVRKKHQRHRGQRQSHVARPRLRHEGPPRRPHRRIQPRAQGPGELFQRRRTQSQQRLRAERPRRVLRRRALHRRRRRRQGPGAGRPHDAALPCRRASPAGPARRLQQRPRHRRGRIQARRRACRVRPRPGSISPASTSPTPVPTTHWRPSSPASPPTALTARSLVDAATILTDAHRAPDLAERCLRDYLASHAKSDEAPAFKVHLQLSRLLAARGDSKDAARELEAAAELAPAFTHNAKPAQGL